MVYFLKDIKQIDLSMRDGNLIVAEKTQLPFVVQRFFIVKAEESSKRGHHAHRQLIQYLLCIHGSCEVICDDGKEKKIFNLAQTNQALLIPPSIWAEQIYHQKDTALLVACDAIYDEADYIRDYDKFLKFRSEMK